MICEYCQGDILDKKKDSRKAEGKRYHITCLRKLRKKIDKQQKEGKIKPGYENQINIQDLRNS